MWRQSLLHGRRDDQRLDLVSCRKGFRSDVIVSARSIESRTDMAHFHVPLDLPHAGRIADRIVLLLERHFEEQELDCPDVMDAAETLSSLLFRFTEHDDNPPAKEAQEVRERAAELGRQLVDQLEAANVRGDRLGQLVRNLFECLELGEEGATISLRAGENPNSLQRPV